MDKDEKQSFLPIPSLPRKKRRLFHRKKHVPPQRKRLVEKSGYINLRIESERRFYHFVRDAYTTLLGMKWRYVVSLYFSTLSTSWIMFAFAYQLQSWYNEDFEVHDGPHTPCIYNTETFTDMLIYSFATQSTVGYGHRHMSNKCIGVVFSSMMQLMLGTLLHGLMTAFIINKMARPMKRTATLMFSKNAVVAMRDGKLCLMVRIGDMRKTCLAEAHVRMQMIQKTMTYEGDMLPYHQFEMDVGFKEGLDRVMVMWPITIVHEINEESPLYTISQESLNDPMTRFEIILILEGVVESSGSTAQARTSYTPSEVLWGRRFDRLATYHRRDGTYQVDMAKFHSTVEASNTPPFSAKQLEFMRKKGQFVEADTTFDEDSLMNQTTIHEIKDHSRPGILTDPTKTDSVSIQIESDNELDEDIPEDDANLAGPHRKHTAVFRRECDLF